jgi:hypothetical protein
MDQATFLRSLLRVIGEVGTDPLSRDQLRTSSGIEEPELGELLEEAVDLGFLTGTEVAEERGPVQAISLTTAGRRTAETVYVDAQTYLGYRITAQPIGTRGSSSGEIFEAERGGELAMRLEFSVTYTAAAGGHQRPDQMAFEMGQSYFRGLLLLGTSSADLQPRSPSTRPTCQRRIRWQMTTSKAPCCRRSQRC